MNNNNQNNAPQPVESNSDLSWQAFCYVANELDAKARRQFEIRLEQDQIARDAVAQAYDDARLLDLALSLTNDHAADPTCELPSRTSQPTQRLKPASSKSLRPALLAIAAAGLLAMMFTQLPRGQTGTEVAQNMGSPNGAVEASMALAETWADSDWHADSQAEIADGETNLTYEDQSNSLTETPEDIEEDDWMTATLIDMAESSLQSGS